MFGGAIPESSVRSREFLSADHSSFLRSLMNDITEALPSKFIRLLRVYGKRACASTQQQQIFLLVQFWHLHTNGQFMHDLKAGTRSSTDRYN